MFDFILFLIILFFAATAGTRIEKKHYKDIQKREIEFFKFPTITSGKNYQIPNRKIKRVELVSGCVVVGADYFKFFISSIHALFGGKLTTLESVMDRARREAILRMKEQARKKGANLVVNVKLETCNLSDIYQKNNAPKASVIAYGTAVTYE